MGWITDAVMQADIRAQRRRRAQMRLAMGKAQRVAEDRELRRREVAALEKIAAAKTATTQEK